MKCNNCGAEIKSGNFCPQCGTMNTVSPTPEPATPPAQVFVQEPVAAPTQVIIQEPVAPPTPVYVPNPPIPSEYTPLSPWEYVLWTFLFNVPLVGTIFLIVFALGGTSNLNLRNYARSYFCIILLVVIIAVVLLLLMTATGAVGMMAISDAIDF